MLTKLEYLRITGNFPQSLVLKKSKDTYGKTQVLKYAYSKLEEGKFILFVSQETELFGKQANPCSSSKGSFMIGDIE